MLKHEDIVSRDYAPTCMTKELAEFIDNSVNTKRAILALRTLNSNAKLYASEERIGNELACIHVDLGDFTWDQLEEICSTYTNFYEPCGDIPFPNLALWEHHWIPSFDVTDYGR